MIAYNRGDVVLVNLMHTDQSVRKPRPAPIVGSAALHASRQDVIVAGITSNVTHRLVGDYQLADRQIAGLVVPSTVTGLLLTIQRTMLGRTLGTLAPADRQAYEQQLRQSLAL